MLDPIAALEKACSEIESGLRDQAKASIRTHFPFVPHVPAARRYSKRDMVKTFVRDGFIDRYRGDRLVFPGALRVLSHYLPQDFPFHKNGKMSEGHVAYWTLFPTIDHILPVARGGQDQEDNWVTCSMLSNSIKSNWLLEELRWELKPCGSLEEWDGLMPWFFSQVKRDPSLLDVPYIKSWYLAGLEFVA